MSSPVSDRKKLDVIRPLAPSNPAVSAIDLGDRAAMPQVAIRRRSEVAIAIGPEA